MPTTAVLNTNAGLVGKTLVSTEGASTITGLLTYDRDPNAPFAVTAASAVVTNLDADKLDGQEGTYYRAAANITGQVALASGGTGANLSDPNADRLVFWDDSAGAIAFLTPVGIAIDGTSVNVPAGLYRCHVYHNTTQTITTATWTALTFNSEVEDVGTLHDPTTNNSRITIPTGAGGAYQFGIKARFATTAANYLVGVRLLLNNAATYHYVYRSAGNISQDIVLLVGYANLAAADYIEAQVYQASGGNMDVGSTAQDLVNTFWAVKLS